MENLSKSVRTIDLDICNLFFIHWTSVHIDKEDRPFFGYPRTFVALSFKLTNTREALHVHH